jgi:hypothetical protein
MKLVNQTNVAVNYWITAEGAGDCGTIVAHGLSDHPGWDNRKNVTVEFLPVGNKYGAFSTVWDTTQTGQLTELTLVTS